MTVLTDRINIQYLRVWYYFYHMTLTYVLAGIFVAMNLVSFTIMAIDKRRSTGHDQTDRIPEGILFFLAAAFGAVGIYLAMFTLRHKTRKWYFQIGIPLLITQQLVLLYVESTLLLSPALL